MNWKLKIAALNKCFVIGFSLEIFPGLFQMNKLGKLMKTQLEIFLTQDEVVGLDRTIMTLACEQQTVSLLDTIYFYLQIPVR